MPTREINNLIKFKAQMLKSYILGMFPKSFCKICEFDNTEHRMAWSHPRIVLKVRYLNGLFTDDYVINQQSVDTELDDFVSDKHYVSIKDITKLVVFRNEVVKCIGLPSKLTLTCEASALKICKKNISIYIEPSKITYYFTPSNEKHLNFIARELKSRVFTLAEPYKISTTEKDLITAYFKSLESLSSNIDSIIDSTILKLSNDVSDLIFKTMNAEK